MEGFGKLPRSASSVDSWTATTSQDELDDLRKLVKLSKVAKPVYENTQEDNRYGVTAKWLSEAKDYWLSKFSWQKCEDSINSFPNFQTEVEHDGVVYQIHFVALFSQKLDAVPVMSIHGWPGSFLEFLPMMSHIRDTYTPETLPFHLIIPSMPGYGYSSAPPVQKNFTTIDTSHIFHEMMVQNLGFGTGYITQGGDVGSFVARYMCVHNEECKGVHLNFCPISKPPESHPAESLTAFEQECLQRCTEFETTGYAYAIEQGTRPSTLGLALASNPIALLAWIGEKFLTWSDVEPGLDTILEDVTLYWLTGTIPSSFYSYRMRFEGTRLGHDHPEVYLKKPFGYSLFPKEILAMPRSWAATTGELSWFRQHDSGGHFAALEKPEGMSKDVADFVEHVVREQKLRSEPV